MIGKILVGLLSFVSSVFGLILSPINTLIATYLPSVATTLSSITAFLTSCVTYIGWVISAVGIPTEVINLITATIIFKLTITPLVHTIKLFLKWYKAIVP